MASKAFPRRPHDHKALEKWPSPAHSSTSFSGTSHEPMQDLRKPLNRAQCQRAPPEHGFEVSRSGTDKGTNSLVASGPGSGTWSRKRNTGSRLKGFMAMSEPVLPVDVKLQTRLGKHSKELRVQVPRSNANFSTARHAIAGNLSCWPTPFSQKQNTKRQGEVLATCLNLLTRSVACYCMLPSP